MPTKLPPVQLKAASMLAEGETCSSVAKKLSVTPQTISTWKKDALFEATTNSIAMEGLKAARIKLHHSVESAIEALTELTRETENPETRRKAAVDVLRLTGFEPGDSSSFSWGIGGTTEEQVEKDRKIAENPMLAFLDF